MLAIFACLFGIFGILVLAEVLWRLKFLRGENLRKFVHITAGSFMAFWPWLISWKAIQIIAVAMIVIVLLNRRRSHLNYLANQRKRYYGDVFLPLAVILTSLITTNELFFAIAILHVALADGLAAVIGANFGRRWQYKVFNHTKTVIGSMTFWLVSVCILGIGLLAGDSSVSYIGYMALLIALPPLLTFIENIAGMGLDNIAVPAVVIIALNIATSAV